MNNEENIYYYPEDIDLLDPIIKQAFINNKQKFNFGLGKDVSNEWVGIYLHVQVKLSDIGINYMIADKSFVYLSNLNKSDTVICDRAGPHKLLIYKGSPVPSDIITLRLLKDDESKDLVFISWFLDDKLPPSQSRDWKFGDRMTVAEALEKGWRVASLY